MECRSQIGKDAASRLVDRFLGLSGEQIRDRVLPIGATISGVRIVGDNSRAPLYLKTPGYAAIRPVVIPTIRRGAK